MTAQAPVTINLELRLENNRLAHGTRTIRVARDDLVAINWSADRRTVLHLHGYDIESVVEPGTQTLMTFRAHTAGRFPIETHGASHRVVVYLEVHPR